MSAENAAANLPAILKQRPNQLVEGQITNAVVAYCQAKSIASSQINPKRITLAMLLPQLQHQNRKWATVKPEHLKRADIVAVKTMQNYLHELL